MSERSAACAASTAGRQDTLRRFALLLCAVLAGVRPAAAELCAGSAGRPAAVTTPIGGLHALTIYARFADQDTGSDELPAHAAELFDADLPGSLTHFFDEMSGQRFRLSGNLWPVVVTAPLTAAEYARDPDSPSTQGRFRDFVLHILGIVDPTLDFGLYDSDGPDGIANSGDDDGYVDFLFLNTLTAPAGFIEAGATGIPALVRDDYVTGDQAANGGFIRIRADDHPAGLGGALQRAAHRSDAVGTMAHEFGHALGLPDLYDLDSGPDATRESAGIGYWGLMGHGNRGWQEQGGPGPLCAWSLAQLGWLGTDNDALIDVTADLRDAPLEDIRRGGLVYRLATRDPLVSYLVAHRRPDGSYYDRQLPAPGLLIWRIDSGVTGNRDETRKLVDLVAADGLFDDDGAPSPLDGQDHLDRWTRDAVLRQTWGGNLGDEGDLYDGVRTTEFSPESNPAAALGPSVLNIRPTAGGMRADLIVDDRRWIGPVVADAMWRDSVWISGDVTVPAPQTLAVDAATVVTVSPGAALIVEGRLVTGAGSGPPTLFTGTQWWAGLRLAPAGWLGLHNTSIERATIGIQADVVRNPPVLSDVTILGSRHAGIHIGSLQADNISIAGTTVADGLSTGIDISGPGRVLLERTTVEGNSGVGLRLTNVEVDVFESRFTDNDTAQILLQRVTGRLRANELAGAHTGLRLVSSANLVVEDNRLSGHTVGLASIDASPDVIRNHFASVDTVATVSGTHVPTTFTLNAVEDAAWLLNNRSAVSLSAPLNWWGSASAAAVAARMKGPVLWDPILDAEPADAGALGLDLTSQNPFRQQVDLLVRVGLQEADRNADLTVDIIAVTGQRVRRLLQRPATPGTWEVVWDGRDDGGRTVASGVYLATLQVGARRTSRSVLLLR